MAGVDAETGTTAAGEVRRFGEVSKGYTFFEDGDLLLAKITPCFENGKIAQAQLSRRLGVGSTEFHVIRPRLERVHDRYILHLLRQDRVRRSGELRMTGSAGQRRVPEAFLNELEVPLPTIEEQRRIADILDRAAALRVKRREAIAWIDDLAQSIFLDMFGDPTNPAAEVEHLDQVVQVQIGPFGSLLHARDYVANGVALVNPTHIVRGRIEPDPDLSVTPKKAASLDLYRLRLGDVVMGRRGEMGRCAIVEREHVGLLCGTGSLVIRPDRERLTPLYVMHVLSSQQMRTRLERLSLGATLPNLNSSIVGSLKIRVPTIELQRQFEVRVRTVGQVRQTATDQLDELQSVFGSLQQQAFSGRL